MKKLIFFALLISAGGCNSLHRLGGGDTSDPAAPSDIITVHGTSHSDTPGVEGFRTDNSTINVRVLKNGAWRTLNQYEFSVAPQKVTLGHEVTILPNGSITYAIPFVYVAPSGTEFEITSILNHLN